MARPATGSPRWNAKDGRWEARVTLIGGDRKPVVMSGIARCVNGTPLKDSPRDCEHCAHARRRAQLISDQARANGAVPESTAETLNEWSVRWFADRERRGLTSVRDDRSHYTLHAAELLGTIAIAVVSREDLERFVERLDRKVLAGEISWKTAGNIWGTVSKMFDDAANAKARDLRARDDNPAKEVRGPDQGDDRAKQFLYPSEFLAFVECPIVPMIWKRAAAVAIYCVPRDGEQRVLTAEAIDREHGTIHVHKAWNRRARVEKSTKTGATRRFSMEANVLPLMEYLCDAAGEGPLVPMPSERDMSRGLKRWLRKAGVTREELFTDTATTKSLTWHDLRATGLTWMAVRGDEPLKIMQRAGHKDFATTQIYIRTAESVRVGFGEVFPPLPPGLFTPEGVLAGFRHSGQGTGPKPPNFPGSWRGGRDSKPTTERSETAHGDDPSTTTAPHESRAIVTSEPPPAIVAKPSDGTTFRHGDQPVEPERIDPDDALRAAIKSAIDAGDLARATALLEVLKASPKPAAVLSIARPGKR